MTKKAPKISLDVEFSFLGPSPFHADFTLCPATAETHYECEVNTLPGYDEVFIRIPLQENENPSLTEIELAFSFLAEEITNYYRAIMTRNKYLEYWDGLFNKAQNLAADMASQQSLFYLPNQIRNSSRVSDLQIKLVQFDMNWKAVNRSVEKQMSYTSTKYGLSNLDHYIEEELADIKSFPINELHSLLGTLERASRFTVTNSYVIIAAVIGFLAAVAGGFVGALVNPS